MERDKQEALFNQKEAMNRAFRVQLTRMAKEKDDLVRRCQHHQQMAKSGSVPAVCSTDLQKLTHENTILRIEKKKQEEQFQVNDTSR